MAESQRGKLLEAADEPAAQATDLIQSDDSEAIRKFLDESPDLVAVRTRKRTAPMKREWVRSCTSSPNFPATGPTAPRRPLCSWRLVSSFVGGAMAASVKERRSTKQP